MKLFQQLLVAPAALGLLAPMAATAAELNLDAVDQYATEEQVTSINQFSDVRPTEWAYQALSNLIERYGCVAGYPDGTYRGSRAMTRYEAAALLNACLDRVTEVTDELKRLMAEFEKELAIIRGRVDGLEAKVGELEANQFSTTTKLNGQATFVLGAVNYGGSRNRLVREFESEFGATTFNYDVQLNFDTSFTGKDLLRTRLRAGNFADSAFGNGLTGMEVAFQAEEDNADTVEINRLFYQFPVGSNFTVTAGGRVRQDDMLAMWPSVYPADTVLDFFTYAGAPGAYNLNLGSGAGIWWQGGPWSVSLNYVAANGHIGNPREGGIGTDGAGGTGTVQLGYGTDNFGAAFAYTYSQKNSNQVVVGTPLASGVPNSEVNSFAVSGYWQPSTTGWIPSISAGWGYNDHNFARSFRRATRQAGNRVSGGTSQSWYVGLQWEDMFLKGNALGMAVGQPSFVTDVDSRRDNFFLSDGNYAMEWWYKFQVTDNISVTPAIFYLSRPEGQFTSSKSSVFRGGGDRNFNQFGGLIKTTFKF